MVSVGKNINPQIAKGINLGKTNCKINEKALEGEELQKIDKGGTEDNFRNGVKPKEIVDSKITYIYDENGNVKGVYIVAIVKNGDLYELQVQNPDGTVDTFQCDNEQDARNRFDLLK